MIEFNDGSFCEDCGRVLDTKEITFLRKVIKAQDRLLMCYRIGSHAPEWALDIVEKFRKQEELEDAKGT